MVCMFRCLERQGTEEQTEALAASCRVCSHFAEDAQTEALRVTGHDWAGAWRGPWLGSSVFSASLARAWRKIDKEVGMDNFSG